jgi:hypothetical protein
MAATVNAAVVAAAFIGETAVVVVVVVVGAAAVATVSEAGLLASVEAGALVASVLVVVAVVASDGSLAFTFVVTVSPVRESSALLSPGKRVALKEKCCLAPNCCAKAGLLASTIKPSNSIVLLMSFDHVPLLLCPFIK